MALVVFFTSKIWTNFLSARSSNDPPTKYAFSSFARSQIRELTKTFIPRYSRLFFNTLVLLTISLLDSIILPSFCRLPLTTIRSFGTSFVFAQLSIPNHHFSFVSLSLSSFTFPSCATLYRPSFDSTTPAGIKLDYFGQSRRWLLSGSSVRLCISF